MTEENPFAKYAQPQAASPVEPAPSSDNPFAKYAQPAPAESDPGKWQNPVMERVRQVTLGLAHAVGHPIETAGNIVSGLKDAVSLPQEVYSGEANLNDPATLDRAIGLGTMISPGSPFIRGATAGGRFGAQGALRQGLEGAGPADISAAARLIDEAKALPGGGVSLPWTQALEHVTNGRTNMTNVERYLMNSRGGGALRDVMAGRPGQVQAAGGSVIRDLGPAGAIPAPENAGLAVQAAAKKSLLDSEAARTAATKDLYQAASSANLPSPDMEKLLVDMDAAIARDKTGEVTSEVARLRKQLIERQGTVGEPAQRTPVLGPEGQTLRYDFTPAIPATPRSPVLDIENLNNARTITRERLGMPQVGADAVTKKQAAAVAPFIGRLKTMMEAASPEFAAANEKFGNITKDVIKPEQAGPLKKLAKTDQITAQGPALLPSKTAPMQEAAIFDAVRKISARDPQAAQALVHSQIRSVFDEATSGLVGRPNPRGGAKFAKNLVGSTQAAKNVEAAIKALPGGATRYKGFQSFINIMEATGRAVEAGSPTEPLREMRITASRGPLSAITGPLKEIKEFAQQVQIGMNAEKLARIVTDRRSEGLLRDLSTQKNYTSQKAILLASKLILRTNPRLSAPKNEAEGYTR